MNVEDIIWVIRTYIKVGTWMNSHGSYMQPRDIFCYYFFEKPFRGYAFWDKANAHHLYSTSDEVTEPLIYNIRIGLNQQLITAYFGALYTRTSRPHRGKLLSTLNKKLKQRTTCRQCQICKRKCLCWTHFPSVVFLMQTVDVIYFPFHFVARYHMKRAFRAT